MEWSHSHIVHITAVWEVNLAEARDESLVTLIIDVNPGFLHQHLLPGRRQINDPLEAPLSPIAGSCIWYLLGPCIVFLHDPWTSNQAKVTNLLPWTCDIKNTCWILYEINIEIKTEISLSSTRFSKIDRVRVTQKWKFHFQKRAPSLCLWILFWNNGSLSLRIFSSMHKVWLCQTLPTAAAFLPSYE